MVFDRGCGSARKKNGTSVLSEVQRDLEKYEDELCRMTMCLLGQVWFLTTVVHSFPPPQSRAKLVADLGHCVPVCKKSQGNVMIIMISEGGKVSGGWQEPRIESAVIMVLPFTAYKTVYIFTVPQHSSNGKRDGKISYFSLDTDWRCWQWCLQCIVQRSSAGQGD